MISLLVWVIIFALIVYVANFIMGYLETPDPIKKVIMVILVVLGLVSLVNQLGFLGGPVLGW